MAIPQKITPCLWFDGQAEAAMEHYMAIFKNSKVLSVTRCGEAGPGPVGSVLVANFELDGLALIALNGGPYFKFNEAVSLSVDCQTQDEVDSLWAQLSAGGSTGQCGWLKDKFGVSWQIVPRALIELMRDPDAEKAKRVTLAMMQMTKIDIAQLRRAHSG